MGIPSHDVLFSEQDIVDVTSLYGLCFYVVNDGLWTIQLPRAISVHEPYYQ